MNIDTEVPKYRKKSTAKGQPRSNHKHMYETVLLIRHHTVPDINTGKQIEKETRFPTKICTICGRIKETDTNQKWYINVGHKDHKWAYFTKELSEASLELPIWFCNGFFDTFAKPIGGKND